MPAPWSVYQQDVAALFRSMGCTVEVEKEVAGARGVHVIDVIAKTAVAGVPITWIVECKLWNTAIPKEKVLALSQVASDVGADRAFLLSESGFQSGAVRASQHTNITLASRQDLMESARSEIERRGLQLLAVRAHRLQRELHDLFVLDDGGPGPPPGADREEFLTLLASAYELHAMVLPKAQVEEFPLMLSSLNAVFQDSSALIPAADHELDRVAACLANVKLDVERVRTRAGVTFAGLDRAIREFLDTSETALRSIQEGSVEQSTLLASLDRMKLVGAQAEELRELVSGKALQALSKLMGALFAGPYEHLAKVHFEPDQWGASRQSVERLLAALSVALHVPATAADPS
jgi:hypothetical protein